MKKNGGYILNHDIQGKQKPGAPLKMMSPNAGCYGFYSHLRAKATAHNTLRGGFGLSLFEGPDVGPGERRFLRR